MAFLALAFSLVGCASAQRDPLIRVFQADETLPCEPDVVRELDLDLEFVRGTEPASLAQSFMWKLQVAGVRQRANAVVMPPMSEFEDSARQVGTVTGEGRAAASYTGLAIRATDPACARALAAAAPST